MQSRLSHKDLPALTALATRATAIEDEVAAQLGMTFAPVGSSERTRAPGHRRIHERARQDPALWARWQEGEAMRWRIAMTMRAIVYSQACAWYGPERGQDAASEALEYVFFAAVSWCPARGAWTTYARNWIRVGLQRGGRVHADGVDLTGRLAEALGRIAANPTLPLEALADDSVTLDILQRARTFRVLSLDRRLPGDDEEGDRWVDSLPDEGPPTDDRADQAKTAQQILDAMAALESAMPRVALAINAYYGQDKTLAATGRLMETPVSRERARQLCREGERALRFLLGVDDGAALHHRTRRVLLEAASA